MYKMVCSMVALGALTPLIGCGQSADGLFQQQVDQLNALADAMEAGAEQAKIDEIQKQVKETGEALDALGLSEDEVKKVGEKYKEEMVKALGRVMKAQLPSMDDMKGKMPPMPSGFGEMPKFP